MVKQIIGCFLNVKKQKSNILEEEMKDGKREIIQWLLEKYNIQNTLYQSKQDRPQAERQAGGFSIQKQRTLSEGGKRRLTLT